jgi:hypothetical protein
MPEFWIGKKQGEIGLEDYQNLLALFPSYADRAIASALRSEGYRLQQVIKTAIQTGGPEGAKWPKLSAHTLMIQRFVRLYKGRQARKAKGKRVKGWRDTERHMEMAANKFPLQKLAGASRYFYNPGEKLVTIGFLDPRKRGLAKMHAQGFEIDVSSERSRRLHFAARMPLKKGTTKLRVPPRPVVSVIFEREGKQIRQNVYEKVFSNIGRYLANKAVAEIGKAGGQ